MKNFATKLKDLREQYNVPQKEIADHLGITRSAYSNYEQGIREPSLDLFQKICQFYEINAEYFWE